MFEIVPAQRESAPITAAFIGGSGSGKTYSALLFARGLVGPEGVIVVMDSEGGRAKIYANDERLKGSNGIAFHHLDLVEPYTSERFREAFKAAVTFGAHAVIIDTISHEHEGFLEYAEQEAARMSNSKASNRNKWIKPKGSRKRFYSAISSSHVHVIATIRLNRIVDMDQTPAKEIMKPECDKDFPYRLDLSVQIEPDHTTKIIKVPEPLRPFVEDGVMIEKRHGAILAEDIGKQAAPKNEAIRKIIVNLEEVAGSGTETFKEAWSASWRNAGPSGSKEDLKKSTPERTEMLKHLDRLKALAVAADETDQPDHAAGEIGEFKRNMPDQDEEAGLFQSGGN